MGDKANTTNGELKDSFVVGKSSQASNGNEQPHDSFVVSQTSQGALLHGTLIKLARATVIFEVHNPTVVLRLSEVLQEFRIIFNGRTLYTGSAVVRNLMNTGPSAFTCEATLNQEQWLPVETFSGNGQFGWEVGAKYQEFLDGWERQYKVLPDFKIAVADIQTFLLEWKKWLELAELKLHSLPCSDQAAREKELIVNLSPRLNLALDGLFEKYERIVSQLDESDVPMHRWYVQRHLHGIVLCAPFAHRTYTKPLGYAGDYEMVNMIVRNAPEGGTLFAKLFNLWLLQQNSAVAHRNRIDYLVRQLVENTLRMARQGKSPRILSIGCGPAQEVQRLLAEYPISSQVDFTLLDFNEETLCFAKSVLSDLKARHHRSTAVKYVKKSVHHMLKDASRAAGSLLEGPYDFIYCGGLFDYLSNQVCMRLMNSFYDMLSPGGLVVVTNVSPFSSNRGSLELILDWHLIYRDARQLAMLCPDSVPPEEARVVSDDTGVNFFLELRKPHENWK
jgi:extracellular factor (EF) 3-hydroxypalmitic acid methyl ester biosynthesis protein